MSAVPDSLLEAIRYFEDQDNSLSFLASLRWPDGKAICPRCEAPDPYFLSTRRVWKCRGCAKQFSVKVGTIFEDSPVGLDKWLPAAWLIISCKNGVSSCEIARALRVTQKTAWFMMHRIRLAMQDCSFDKCSGEVEVDETFIGGKARHMHLYKRQRGITGTGGQDKTAVMGILQRGGKVRTKVVSGTKKKILQAEVKKHVEAGAVLYTDALKSYEGLAQEYGHGVIDHAVKYVDGRIHTNGLENFWSLLKRSINGSYVSVEPYHLFRYLDEQAFRFNNRDMSDGQRFVVAMRQIVGRRVTFEQLTGQSGKEDVRANFDS